MQSESPVPVKFATAVPPTPGGGLNGSLGTEVTPILTTVKRAGLIRAGG